MPTYKTLCQKNPDWDGLYWRRTRALYAGGKKLLGDRAVMADVFPTHLAEKKEVYDERCKRAYYIPYPGEILDMITSALFSEDMLVTGTPDPDPWYAEWIDDVSPPGGAKQTLRQFLKQQLITALCCKRAWTLIDLPAIAEAAEAEPANLKAQEDMGMLDAYACGLDPECVWDWECDDDGELLWLLVHYQYARRDGIEGTRDVITEEWTYYDQQKWQKYRVRYTKAKPVQEADQVPIVAEGAHSFGRVPVISLDLPDGLWAMGKIESIAVAHFNKRNALSWAEYKSLFPVMVHYAGPPDALNPATDDPDRVLNQTIGQGYVVQLGDKDRLEYAGPETGAYAIAQKDLDTLRDEMHRVVHQMAQSVDNSAAALQRSAASKQVDASAAAVVLREFGKIVREHVIEMFEVVQTGRQDARPVAWEAEGMDDYDDVTVETLITSAQTMELISVPSATFQRAWKFQLARRVLGDSITDEQVEEIKNELEENITNEQFHQAAAMAKAGVDAIAANPDGAGAAAAGIQPPSDEQPASKAGKQAVKAKKKPGKGRTQAT